MPVLGSLGPTGFTIPDIVYNAGGYGNVVYSLVYQQAAEIDNYMDDSFRNLGKGFNPLDIPAADIARGRINGLPDYHTLRVYFYDSIYGKAGCTYNSNTSSTDPIQCFSYITSNITFATKLQSMFYRVDRIDPIVGMFFEDKQMDSPVGPTMARAILREYERKRDADRYWFLNQTFDQNLLDYITNRTMVQVMNDNFGTNITSFFHVMPQNKNINCPSTTSTGGTSSSATSGSTTSSTNTNSSTSASSTKSTSSSSTTSSIASSSTSTVTSTTSSISSTSSTASTTSSASSSTSSVTGGQNHSYSLICSIIFIITTFLI